MAVRDTVEEDSHLKRFGKKAEEVYYYADKTCPFCNNRIDEFGLCGCFADVVGASWQALIGLERFIPLSDAEALAYEN